MTGVSRILCVCNDQGLTAQLREALIIKGNYSVRFEDTYQKGLDSLNSDGFELVVIKFHGLINEIKEFIASVKKKEIYCPVIVLFGEQEEISSEELLGLDIYDFIRIPKDQDRLIFLIEKALHFSNIVQEDQLLYNGIKEKNDFLNRQNIHLTKRIEDSARNLSRLYEDLRSTYMHTIKALAQAIEAKDHYTHSHSENVARYAVVIAEEMGVPSEEIEIIREACLLHDLGKIAISSSILDKPASLNEQEWCKIKEHPLIGARILEPLKFLDKAIELIKQHHEHYDGKGYPEGKRGEEILLAARIIHLADAYDSMCSGRPYRKRPFTKEEAIAEIKSKAGKQFDPAVTEAFLRIADKLN